MCIGMKFQRLAVNLVYSVANHKKYIFTFSLLFDKAVHGACTGTLGFVESQLYVLYVVRHGDCRATLGFISLHGLRI